MVETIETSLGSIDARSRFSRESPPFTPSPPQSAVAAEGGDGGGGEEGGVCVQVLMDFVPRLVLFWVLSLSCSLTHSSSLALPLSQSLFSRSPAHTISLSLALFVDSDS